MTAQQLYDSLKTFDLNQEVRNGMQANERQIVDLNRSQLLEGKKSDGNKITPQYRRNGYALNKNQRNSRPGFGTPDLYLRGDFQNAMFLLVNGNIYSFDSRDSKRGKLVGKYSEAIFGLTPENQRKMWVEILTPYIRQRLSDVTGLRYKV